MQQRRKSPFAAAPAAAKPEGEEAPARRPGAPLSLAGLLVCIFLVAIFLYNEDAVVKPPADAGAGSGDFPLAGASRARSAPDLHLLHEVNPRSQQQQQDQEEAEERHHAEKAESRRKATGGDSEPARLVDAAPARVADKRAAPAMTTTTTAPSSGSNATSRAAAVSAPEPPACNLYQGWWTYDADASQVPLYKEPECEFLTEQVTCMRNGRRDDSYQRWRWQPSSCDLPRYVRRAGAAGEASEQEADVRGGLAEPEPVGIHGVPGVVGDPGAGAEDAGQVRGAQRLAQRVHGQGVQRDGGVLLGAVPGAVQLRRPAGAQRHRPGHRVAVHRQARPPLARRPLPRLQHLHLVAQQLRHQSAEESEGDAGEVHAGGPAGGVQGGAQDVGQVGGQARRPQENQGLLHGHVPKPRRAGRVGRGPGGGQVRHGDAAHPQPHGAALHRHRLAAARRGGGRAALHAPRARPPRRHHRAVRVPQGRAHLRAHAQAGEAADSRAAGRPARLCRLHPLVPPRPPRHLEPLPLRPDRRLAAGASAAPAVVVLALA